MRSEDTMQIIRMPAARDAEAAAYDAAVIAGQAKLIARLRRSHQRLACGACAGWAFAIALLVCRAIFQ